MEGKIFRFMCASTYFWMKIIAQQETKLSLGYPTSLPHSRPSSSQGLLLNKIASSCFPDIGLDVLGSRVWPIGVAWRYWSHNHLIPHMPFPIGDPLSRTLSAAVFKIFGCNRVGVVTLTFQGHVTLSVTWPYLIPHRLFPIGGPLEPSQLRFRDIQWRMWRNGWH